MEPGHGQEGDEFGHAAGGGAVGPLEEDEGVGEATLEKGQDAQAVRGDGVVRAGVDGGLEMGPALTQAGGQRRRSSSLRAAWT